MEELRQLHSPTALSPGKGPSVLIAYEAWWALEPVRTLWKKDKSLWPFQELNRDSQVVQPVAWALYWLSGWASGGWRCAWNVAPPVGATVAVASTSISLPRLLQFWSVQRPCCQVEGNCRNVSANSRLTLLLSFTDK
jgi:hypothetical protein